MTDIRGQTPTIGDTVTAVARPEIADRKSYTGKLVEVRVHSFSIQGAPFEVRDFAFRLWELKSETDK